MNFERNFLKKTSVAISCMLIAIITVACNGRRERAFEKEVKTWGVYQQQIVLPMLVYAEDSAVLLVCSSCHSLVEEVCKLHHVDSEEARAMIYDAFNRKLPLRVSCSFYQEALGSRIRVIPHIDSIYRKKGIKGIIGQFFQKKGKSLFLDETSFSPEYDSGRLLPAEEDYIIYLLSLHKMYIYHVLACEVPIVYTKLADRISEKP